MAIQQELTTEDTENTEKGEPMPRWTLRSQWFNIALTHSTIETGEGID
ncbi:hypothetical protein Poly41_06380 [Novipirellula artificiosorum]|uniref:Uncharacterized protein n=1 Tax=Novipirellula artificiosorum TaxID=2528016 RepID=A0A5C6E428_9BACT|nr:hypothetical protein Poly41_06380 [Novipirellula artificiosorum]